MSINIWTDSMQHAALLGKPVLFTNWLIQRDIIPDGWYCYDLRGTHKSPSTRTTLVDHAADYHAGTVLSPIPLKHEGTASRRVNGTFYLLGEEMTLEQFCEEHDLAYPQDNREFVLRPASLDEVGLFYSEEKLDEALGNLTYNTDICCFAPRVSNHEELGAFLYANEMLSNEAMALLDTTEEGSGFQERLLELLGEQHQEDHGGVFTDFGYAELGGEIKDIYVCQSNETACFHRSDAPVVLEVRKGFFNDPSYDNDKTAVLNLPAADAGIWRAVEKVDAASVDECAFRCVDCLIPFLRDAINNAIDDEDGIEQADEFAKRLAQIEREWPESDMVKYKALLSVVDHPSLQDATRLMGEIDQYELRPEVAQTWGYAEMMFREKYSALPEELFQTPQAAQIGQKMLDDRLGVITEYGLIRRKDGQPFPVFQPEQEIGQGLEMM